MQNLLPTSRSIHRRGVIQLGIDSRNRREENNGIITHGLPDICQHHKKLCRSRIRQQCHRGIPVPRQSADKRGKQAVVGKQRKHNGINNNPADEIRYGNRRLHGFLEFLSPDLRKQNGDHPCQRQPQQSQDTDYQRV